LPKIEQLTGHQLYKTYSYARQYEIGNSLKPHRDRKACEITATLALGVEEDIWPIWLEDGAKTHHSFLLKPGDALIFRGHELSHWREENTFGRCSQVFLHYVDRNGPYAYCKDDAAKA
jgi:alkylated DNA repair dioxygenase AlkB